MLVSAFTSGTAPMVTSKRGPMGKITTSSYFQQRAISRSDVLKIYGTEEQFLQNYKEFQQAYFKALDTDLHITKSRGVNMQMLRREGRIDLSVLNDEAASRLDEMYKTKVLKLPQLLQQVGLPSAELPSANLYRGAYKFEVEMGDQLTHPIQVLLNRTVFNFNPNKTGLASLNVGRGNIFSANALERTFRQGQQGLTNVFAGTQGLNIMTLDVETTGVFSGSQVRSMSMRGMTVDESGAIKLADAAETSRFNIGFKSSQMGGLTVRTQNSGVKSIFDFISTTEMDGKPLLDMGEGGKTFLDESTAFIERLLLADRIAGHNVMFDIGAITSTMTSQSAFATHKGAQEAVDKLYTKINQGDFLMDTLQSASFYLQKQVQDLVDSKGITDVEQRSKFFVKNLFAEEIQARVHIGGSASYASVENIALNTNLFELIEKSDQAEELFDLITKGSHIAETDTLLQSHIAQYIHTGELKIRGTSTDTVSDFGRYARSRILQSSAITPTTSIADVQHLSDTAFKSITQKDAAGKYSSDLLKKVTIRAKASALNIASQNLADEGILQYFTGADELSKVRGITSSGFYYVTGDTAGTAQLVDEDIARTQLASTLQSARSGSLDKQISVGNKVKSINTAAQNIIDTGWTIGQASAANELENVGQIKIATMGRLPTEDLPKVGEVADIFKDMYKTMGAPMGIAPGGYAVGLNNYSTDFANNLSGRLANIGDPLHFISMQDRTLSSGIARATAGITEQASSALVRSGLTELGGLGANAKLTANLGMSTFYSGKTARLFSSTTGDLLTSSKAIVPLQVLQQSLSDVFKDDFAIKNVSLSVSTFRNKNLVNTVWNANKQINKDEARSLAKSLFDNMSDIDKVAKIMGSDTAKLDQTIHATSNAIGAIITSGKKDQAVEQLAELIMSRGVVFASAGEKSDEIIQTLTAQGIPTDTDVFLSQRTASVAAITDDHVVLNAFVDRKVIGLSTEAGRALDEAESLVNVNGKKVSKAALRNSQIGEVLSEDAGEARKLAGQMERIAAGKSTNSMLDFYNKFKPHIGYGMAAAAALGTGYYISKKHRERQLYDQTLEQQPLERARTIDQYNSFSSFGGSLNSVRRDPLATAGVVGNLDRRSINHTSMSKDRYNHLYGG